MCTLRAAYTKIKPHALIIICGPSAAKVCKSANINSITLENHFGVENADFLLIQKQIWPNIKLSSRLSGEMESMAPAKNCRRV